MVDFLNNFSNSCTHRLFVFDRKISKIEAELRLLEIKLNSIPGFQEEKLTPAPVVPETTRTEQVPSESSEPQEGPSTPDGSTLNQPKTDAKPEEPNEPEPPEVDPAILKYVKMVKVGVPIPAVKLKMQAEGLDPELLKM